jgi:hypothetical protein
MKDKYFPYILISFIFIWCIWCIGISWLVVSWHPELTGGPIPPLAIREQALGESVLLSLIPIAIIVAIFVLKDTIHQYKKVTVK